MARIRILHSLLIAAAACEAAPAEDPHATSGESSTGDDPSPTVSSEDVSSSGESTTDLATTGDAVAPGDVVWSWTSGHAVLDLATGGGRVFVCTDGLRALDVEDGESIALDASAGEARCARVEVGQDGELAVLVEELSTHRIARYDADGHRISDLPAPFFESTTHTRPDLAIAPNGLVISSGTIYDSAFASRVTAFDGSGEVWSDAHDPSPIDTEAGPLALMPNGDIVVAVLRDGLDDDRFVLVRGLDAASGSHLFRAEHSFGAHVSTSLDLSSLVVLGDRILVAGRRPQIYLAAFTPSSTELSWGRDLTEGNDASEPALAVHPSGGIVITYQLDAELVVALLDAEGQPTWETTLPTTDPLPAAVLAVDDVGDIYVSRSDNDGDVTKLRSPM